MISKLSHTDQMNSILILEASQIVGLEIFGFGTAKRAQCSKDPSRRALRGSKELSKAELCAQGLETQGQAVGAKAQRGAPLLAPLGRELTRPRPGQTQDRPHGDQR